VAVADGKFRLVGEHWGIAGPSLSVVFFGGVFTGLAALPSDQNVVQRYQSTPGVAGLETVMPSSAQPGAVGTVRPAAIHSPTTRLYASRLACEPCSPRHLL
jgi:hypothetical protein